ncbi:MAG: hypothetical protein M8467_13435 [Anaerolineae bacterium]|nr:hypothetical protein [Anaerolineae bacterium]
MPVTIESREREVVFRISGEAYQQLVEWQHSVDEKVVQQELESGRSPRGRPLEEIVLEAMRTGSEEGDPVPYYGAIQGAYVYRFVPTTMGLIVKIENTETGDVLDLTNYTDE